MTVARKFGVLPTLPPLRCTTCFYACDFLVESLRKAVESGSVRRDIPAEGLALTVIGPEAGRREHRDGAPVRGGVAELMYYAERLLQDATSAVTHREHEGSPGRTRGWTS